MIKYLCIFFTVAIIFASSSENPENEKIYDFLIKKISQNQYKKEHKYNNLFWMAHRKGLYKSYNKLNTNGNLPKRLFRQIFNNPDNNMFVTTFIIRNYLELYNLNEIELPKTQIEMALEAISKFRDKNNPEISFYNFWAQEKNEKGTYSQIPENIQYPINFLLSFLGIVLKTTKFLRLDSFSEKLSFILTQAKEHTENIHIPPDVDDTSMNINIGNFLSRIKSAYPSLYKTWQKNNPNLKKTYKKISEFNYKPFSNSENNYQDPRTYFFIKDYLKTKKLEKIELTSTWLFTTKNSAKNYPYTSIPGHLNNVDLNVITNYLISFTGFALYQDASILEDEKLVFVYKENLKLIFWVIKNNKVFERYDIGLLYYPNVYTFYWFFSKIYSLIEEFPEDKELPQLFRETSQLMEEFLVKDGVSEVKKHLVVDGEDFYWQSFLGESEATGEDRLFNTSLAINFFLNVWARKSDDLEKGSGCKLQWKGILEEERNMILKSVGFLKREIQKNNLRKDNAFFSASVKGDTTIAFEYPANFGQYINGDKLDNFHDNYKAVNAKLMYGVRGYIEEEEYEKMMEKVWVYGTPLVKEFQSLNKNPFPYWSSPALTYSVALLAIAKFNHLERCS